MTERVEHHLARQVAAQPKAPAISDTTGAAWTWSDLAAAAADMALLLRGEGVQSGDRVMLVTENCAASVAAMLGGWQMGAVMVPVNARQTAPEIDRVVAHAEPAAVLFADHVAGDAAAHADRFQAWTVSGGFGRLRMACPHDSAPDAVQDLAVILYTTGTTGTPKGVMLTHANLLFGGRASCEFRSMSSADWVYGVLPITHVFGLASIMVGGMIGGARLSMEARFSPAKLYEALTSGVTLFSGVPQMHAQLMHYVRERGHDRLGSDSLRYVSSGAAPLDPEWKRQAEAFYGVAIQNGYGMTETTAGVAVSRNQIGSLDISCGPLIDGCELRIDETVPGGGDGAGEVVTRGPNIMRGYYRNPEATAQVLDSEGWLRTGDLGRVDAAGHLHILGRSKELIIHGGFNVYPPEVEAALNEHPQVIQCAVIGRPRDGDEEVLAFVMAAAADMPDVADLRSFVAARLAGYKRPSKIIVATALPAAPTGKILKHKLIDQFADWLS